MFNIFFNRFYVIYVLFLPVIIFTSCNKKAEISDKSIIGSWNTIIDEDNSVVFVKFNSDHGYRSYKLDSGRKFDESTGTWQLIKEENFNYIYLSGRETKSRSRDWNDRFYVEFVGDTLIFSSIKSGKRVLALIRSE